MTPKTDPAIVDAEIVYLGQREMISEDKGRILVGTFMLKSSYDSAKSADDLDAIASPFGFKRNKLPKVVGGIYKVRAKIEDGRLKSLVPEYSYLAESIVHVTLLAAFQARDAAARVAERVRKMEAEAKAEDNVGKLLAPLRQRYLATDRIGRLALEVVVLSYLRVA